MIFVGFFNYSKRTPFFFNDRTIDGTIPGHVIFNISFIWSKSGKRKQEEKKEH